jgi:Fur family ferric uptake transcriptional regulator
LDKLQQLSHELQRRKQKVTKQRLAILSVLDESITPLTVEEIFFRVRENNDNNISLATIYRNLKTLLVAGMVEKQGINDDKTQYGLKKDDHAHHLVCLGCRKVICLPNCPLEEFTTEIKQKKGFTVTEHRVELYGYCLDCRNNKDWE